MEGDQQRYSQGMKRLSGGGHWKSGRTKGAPTTFAVPRIRERATYPGKVYSSKLRRRGRPSKVTREKGER